MTYSPILLVPGGPLLTQIQRVAQGGREQGPQLVDLGQFSETLISRDESWRRKSWLLVPRYRRKES